MKKATSVIIKRDKYCYLSSEEWFRPSVVALVIGYVLLALEGDGEIVIGDALLQSCGFERLVKLGGYGRFLKFYYGKAG